MITIDKYIYTYHRNIFSSNHNKILRAHHILFTFISDYIKLENKYIYGMPTTLIRV